MMPLIDRLWAEYPEQMALAKRYHERNVVWGSLHVVLEDGNTSDDNVRFCIEWAEQERDADGVTLAKWLLSLPRRQRIRVGDV
jgi:hypothetical protein